LRVTIQVQSSGGSRFKVRLTRTSHQQSTMTEDCPMLTALRWKYEEDRKAINCEP